MRVHKIPSGIFNNPENDNVQFILALKRFMDLINSAVFFSSSMWAIARVSYSLFSCIIYDLLVLVDEKNNEAQFYKLLMRFFCGVWILVGSEKGLTNVKHLSFCLNTSES